MRVVLLLSLLVGLALPSFALDVTQGESVTLQLNITNSGEVPLNRVHVQWEDPPEWLTPAESAQVTLPISGRMSLPVTFQVDTQAPIGEDVPITLDLVDAEGSRWSQSLPLTVHARPVPEQPQLLPSFPNPCNPETWIPYQLQQASDVSVRIYDLRGHLVRQLHLGHREAGWYTSRDQSAHWDGRNRLGESVSSGVYLVQLQAGEFRAMRKLLVRR